MKQNAIINLREEMDQNQNNSYIQVIGEFLLKQVEAYPQISEKILDTGKTIAKSLDEMSKAASKKKVGNCAVLTDAEGYAIVLKYFGISAVDAPIGSRESNSTCAPTTPPPPQISSTNDSATSFDIRLEDLL